MDFLFCDVMARDPSTTVVKFVWWDKNVNVLGYVQVTVAAIMCGMDYVEMIKRQIETEIGAIDSLTEVQQMPEVIAERAANYYKVTIPADRIKSALPDPNMVAQWKQDGKCPKCGELGKYIGLAPTCSQHGVY